MKYQQDYGSLDCQESIDSILCFEIPFLEHQWSNPSLINEFPNIKETNQVQATWFAVKNNKVGAALIKKWNMLCQEDNFKRLKETGSPNSHQFREHRHDQSVFSCVIKSSLEHVCVLPWEDMYQPWLYDKNSTILLAPVHSLRNASDVSILNALVSKSSLGLINAELLNGPSQAKKLKRQLKRIRFLCTERLVNLFLKLRSFIRLILSKG